MQASICGVGQAGRLADLHQPIALVGAAAGFEQVAAPGGTPRRRPGSTCPCRRSGRAGSRPPPPAASPVRNSLQHVVHLAGVDVLGLEGREDRRCSTSRRSGSPARRTRSPSPWLSGCRGSCRPAATAPRRRGRLAGGEAGGQAEAERERRRWRAWASPSRPMGRVERDSVRAGLARRPDAGERQAASAVARAAPRGPGAAGRPSAGRPASPARLVGELALGGGVERRRAARRSAQRRLAGVRRRAGPGRCAAAPPRPSPR